MTSSNLRNDRQNGARVLFLDQFSQIFGAQRWLLTFLEVTRAAGITGIVCIPQGGPLASEVNQLGVSVEYAPLPNLTNGRKGARDVLRYVKQAWPAATHIIQMVKKHDVQILYCNGPRTYAVAHLASLRTGVDVVWHVHSVFTKPFDLLVSRMIGTLGPRRIVAVAQAAAAPLELHNPLIRKKIRVIMNGVPAKAFTAPRADKPESASVTVGMLARLSPEKGIEVFIKAAAAMLQRYDKVNFVIAGDAFDGVEGEKYEHLVTEKISRTGCSRGIRRTAGTHDAIYDFDVLVVPSIPYLGCQEACPLIVIEGMAAGIPVVASDLGGIKEIIEHNVTGLLFKPGDNEALENAVSRLLERKDERRRLALAGRLKAQLELTAERNATRVMEVLGDCPGHGCAQ